MTDKIVYLVVTEPGGVDGRDPSAKGGVKYASFEKADAEKHLDAWSKLKVDVIEDVEDKTAKLIKEFTPVARLLLGYNLTPIDKVLRIRPVGDSSRGQRKKI